MVMRRKVSAVVKVKKTWRCPKCGHKIETAECYGCLIEEQRRLKAVSSLTSPGSNQKKTGVCNER